ncbi:hypothetical protein OG529_04230 [Streptomyces longwoodensis]|uniref:zinc finger domain-containing protein n=1 Tax=Streptomyces longwoodensis TaxID=68231 RepID=UPI0032466642
MTPAEVVMLAAYVHALCPAQKIDEYTPDAWCDVFAAVPHFSLADCREGAARVAARQPFIAPAEIIEEVRKIREQRLDDFQYEPMPGETGAESIARRREQVAQCADGLRPPVLAVAGARPRPELQSALESMAEGLAVPKDGDQADAAERRGPGKYARPCPKCDALVGRPCRTPHGKIRLSVHAERKNGGEAAPVRQARTALSALTPEQRAALLAELEVQP